VIILRGRRLAVAWSLFYDVAAWAAGILPIIIVLFFDKKPAQLTALRFYGIL